MKRIMAVSVGVLLLSLHLGMLAGATDEIKAEAQTKKHPRVVLIIRHAEKPPAEDKSVHLSAEGSKRADALPQLFQASAKRADPFPVPAFLFATKNSKHSHRPLETVTVLAKTLKLPVNTNYDDEDFAKLAQEILEQSKYAGKTILISWHHGTIPNLARQLKAADAPDHWKGTVFDRVWQITYDEAGKAAFLDRPQLLLPTDSEK